MALEDTFQHAQKTPLIEVRAAAQGPGLRVVEVSGEIDLATVGIMEAAIAKAMQPPPPMLLVDLSGVTFMSSTGLNVLIRTHKDAEQSGTDLRIVSGSRPVHRAFTLTSLDEFFHLYPSRDRALENVPVTGNA